jgi:hypothetical protein
MPAFQKIGGILSNNVTQDIASLHVAVIAINQAVNSNSSSLMVELRNPAARLQHLSSRLEDKYRHALVIAKKKKTEAAFNRVSGMLRAYITLSVGGTGQNRL